mmetsp:Transcript_49900/g.131296  ORF Transcript_49900/g.131296 Transcript_49900/m.131296 type:complete len:245 (-) Transcript_49900:77-811(-)
MRHVFREGQDLTSHPMQWWVARIIEGVDPRATHAHFRHGQRIKVGPPVWVALDVVALAQEGHVAIARAAVGKHEAAITRDSDCDETAVARLEEVEADGHRKAEGASHDKRRPFSDEVSLAPSVCCLPHCLRATHTCGFCFCRFRVAQPGVALRVWLPAPLAYGTPAHVEVYQPVELPIHQCDGGQVCCRRVLRKDLHDACGNVLLIHQGWRGPAGVPLIRSRKQVARVPASNLAHQRLEERTRP